jgi:hypothetical protein
MRQAFHIFKKDARGSAYEICVMLALVALFAASESATRYALNGFTGSLSAMLIVAWFYLTALVIHPEAIPGDRQFWLTRPYSWKSLLAAKIALLILVVGPPLAIADGIILHAQGFPVVSNIGGILWQMLQRFEIFLIPAMVLACLTRSLAGFIVSGLGTIAALVLYFSVSLWNGREIAIWEEAVWVSAAMEAILVPVAILCQYARRKRIALTGAVCAFVLPLIVGRVPQPLRFPEQLKASGLQVQLATEVSPESGADHTSTGGINILLSLRVEGLPPGLDANAKDIDVTLRSDDGELWRSDHARFKPGRTFEEKIFRERFPMPAEVYERFKNEPVQLYSRVELTLYRTVNRTRIEAGEFVVPGVGYCRLFMNELNCRAALHQPDRLFSFEDMKGERLQSPDRLGSISSLVTDLGIGPVVSFSLPVPRESGTILIGEPAAHLARDFYLRDIDLKQYAIIGK